MSKKQDRTVSKRPDGKWENKKNSNQRASTVHSTQRDAINHAKDMIFKDGGGELTVKNANGKIRSKDTIYPGNDPCPPKDKEH